MKVIFHWTSAALVCLGLATSMRAENGLQRPWSPSWTSFSRLLLGARAEAASQPRLAASTDPADEGSASIQPNGQERPEAGSADWSRPALGRWAFDVGVAVILDNSTLDALSGQANDADGDAGGQIYNIGASYLLKELKFTWGERTFRPHLEFRGGVGVVDQNSGGIFMNYMTDLTLRWRDFPWNRYVLTSVGVGGGFWYSEKVLAIDRQRHEGEDRSHLKFYLPMELTLACPKYPRLEAFLFNHHASGGHIFDEGGIDTWGGGIRMHLP